MSTMEGRKPVPVADAARGTARTPWLVVTAIAALTALLLAASGFLFGTVEGDIPWPATQADETVYYTARGLEWGAIAVAMVGAIAVAVFTWWRAHANGWLPFVVTLVASAVLGGVAFFTAYAFGHANYLFAFTS